MRIVNSKIFYFIVGISLTLPLQGCDQVNKLVEYFSPKKTTSAPAAPAPVSVKPITSAPSAPATPAPAVPAASAKPAASGPLPSNVLARVGNWQITVDEFKDQENAAKELAAQNKLTYDLPSERLLGMIVEQQLLYQEAQRTGIDKDSKIAKQIEEARKLILSQTLQSKIVEGISVNDQEIKDFYEQNKQFYFEPAQYKINQIVVDSEAQANDLFAQLAQGASFESLATTSKVAAPANAVTEEEMPFQKIKDVVKALDVGKFSSPFSGPDGFYIVKLESKSGGVERSLDEVKEGIKADLSYLKYLQNLQKLQEAIPVETNPDLIKSLDNK